MHLLRSYFNNTKEVTAVEKLLEVSLKLHSIAVVVRNHKLLSKNSVISHQETLHPLMLGTGKGRPRRYYAPDEMREIVQACLKLQFITIDMPPVELGTTDGLADTFCLNALSPKSEFDHVLVSNLSQLAFPSY
jgi:hypothetical protein